MKTWLMLLCVFIPLLCAQPTVSIAPIPESLGSYISILVPGTQAYDAALATLLSGTQILDRVRPILPYSIIVKNISSVNLRGLSVTFRFEDSSRVIRPYEFTALQMDSGRPGLLAAGEFRFFCPDADISRAILLKRSAELDRPRSGSVMASNIVDARKIAISIEGVVMPDGRFRGSDSLSVSKRLRAEQAADMWLAARLAELKSLNERISLLKSVSSSPIPSESEKIFDGDPYARKLHDTAGLLLTAATKQGDVLDNFISVVRRSIVLYQ